MTAKTHRKRRMKLLGDLAQMAGGRHDVKLPLTTIAPSLDIKAFPRFVDRGNPQERSMSDLAYDYSTLVEEGMIKPVYLDHDRGPTGEVIGKNPGITVTPKGFDVIEELNQSWLSKAIEKQPITFLQIVVTVLIAILSWAVGRYVTPVHVDSGRTPSVERVLGEPNAPALN